MVNASEAGRVSFPARVLSMLELHVEHASPHTAKLDILKLIRGIGQVAYCRRHDETWKEPLYPR